MRPKVYIDGKEGTTGLQIYDRLAVREDIELLLIDESKRKDPAERKQFLNAADLVFLCLPDAAAVEAVSLIENGQTRVIDCSTAHRTAEGWTYGFPELTGQREAIRTAARVANPGCYATGFLSLVRPLVEKGALSPKARLTCHALSGYTGAGKKAVAQYTDPDRDKELESPRHYAVTLAHKHLPEMQKIAGLDYPPAFLPVLGDVYKGMCTTVMLHNTHLGKRLTAEEIYELLAFHYGGGPVVKVAPFGEAPARLYTSQMAGTDSLLLTVTGHDGQTLITALFDNLGKGASGAAVQNMNLMLGFEETTGLNL